MSHRYLPFAIVLVAWSAVARAGDPPPQTVPPYELKNRSEFVTSTTNPRPPFWPIGWVHRDASSPIVLAQPAVNVSLDVKFFKVTSILLGSGTTPSLAIINGRPYTEGEFVRMPKTQGAPPVRVRVLRINDGSVFLQHADHTMIAALKHDELQSRKPEELLIDQDR
jgi:hypothetical protein